MDQGFLIDNLLKGAVVPAVVSLVLLAIGWAGVRKAEQVRGRLFWGALAFGGGFAFAYWLTLGLPEFPPVDTTKWIPYFAVAAAVLGLIAGLPKSPWWLTALLRLAASVALPLALLQPTIKYTWQDGAWPWIAGFAIGLFILWTITDAAARQLKGAAAPLALATTAALLAVALLLGRSAMLAQTAGMLAAVTGAAFVVGLWRNHLNLAFGAIPVYIVVYVSLVLSGHYYAELPSISAILLVLAPAVMVFALGVPAKRSFARTVLAFVLALLVTGAATGYTYMQVEGAPDEAETEEYDYGF